MTATLTKQFTMPNLLLRLEGLVVLGAAIAVYANGGHSWWLFGGLLLAPDLAALPYLVSQRWGAIAYNAVHTYVGPMLLLLLASSTGSTLSLQLALIWFAHIGMDRMVGYGLKYVEGFKQTHLGRV